MCLVRSDPLNDEDEYVMQIVDNEVRVHNLSAEERAKAKELAIRKAMIKAKRTAKRKKRERRKAKDRARFHSRIE